MPFSEMSVHNLRNALAWVRSHEWGRNAQMSADGVLFGCVHPADCDRASQSRFDSVNFVSLHEVATWAGY